MESFPIYQEFKQNTMWSFKIGLRPTDKYKRFQGFNIQQPIVTSLLALVSTSASLFSEGEKNLCQFLPDSNVISYAQSTWFAKSNYETFQLLIYKSLPTHSV